jgi:cell division protein FtsL
MNKKLFILAIAIFAGLVVAGITVAGAIIIVNQNNTRTINTDTKSSVDNTTDEQNEIDNNDTEIVEESSYKEYLLGVFRDMGMWNENDIRFNKMNTFEMNLLLEKTQEENYILFDSVMSNLQSFFFSRGWERIDTIVEGNLFTDIYQNPILADRTVNVKYHPSVGSPTLSLTFNYLANDNFAEGDAKYRMEMLAKLHNGYSWKVTETNAEPNFDWECNDGESIDLNNTMITLTLSDSANATEAYQAVITTLNNDSWEKCKNISGASSPGYVLRKDGLLINYFLSTNLEGKESLTVAFENPKTI